MAHGYPNRPGSPLFFFRQLYTRVWQQKNIRPSSNGTKQHHPTLQHCCGWGVTSVFVVLLVVYGWLCCCGGGFRLTSGGVGMGWFDSDEGPVWVVTVVLWLFAFVVVAQGFRWLLS